GEYLEVVMDLPYMGGHSLGHRCSESRGANLKKSHVLNITQIQPLRSQNDAFKDAVIPDRIPGKPLLNPLERKAEEVKQRHQEALKQAAPTPGKPKGAESTSKPKPVGLSALPPPPPPPAKNAWSNSTDVVKEPPTKPVEKRLKAGQHGGQQMPMGPPPVPMPMQMMPMVPPPPQHHQPHHHQPQINDLTNSLKNMLSIQQPPPQQPPMVGGYIPHQGIPIPIPGGGNAGSASVPSKKEDISAQILATMQQPTAYGSYALAPGAPGGVVVPAQMPGVERNELAGLVNSRNQRGRGGGRGGRGRGGYVKGPRVSGNGDVETQEGKTNNENGETVSGSVETEEVIEEGEVVDYNAENGNAGSDGTQGGYRGRGRGGYRGGRGGGGYPRGGGNYHQGGGNYQGRGGYYNNQFQQGQQQFHQGQQPFQP
ncbi:hypothetical protein HDV05_002322, partial [Chytridiales sp. JEL 0842]